MVAWSKEVFASNLQRYMNAFGKNQKEIAEIVGVSAPTVNEWIKAKKYPRIDKIEILADYFGILKSDLIEDKTQKSSDIENEITAMSENQKLLIEFAKSVPDDKAGMILRVMKSILEDAR